MALVTCGSIGVIIAGGILKQVLTGITRARVAVAVAVHDVAAHTEVLVFLAADVKVDTGILRRSHTAVAAETLETSRGAIAESQVIGIVSSAQDGKLVAIAEVVDHHVAGIAVVGAVARINRAEPSVVHTFLDGEVDDRLVLAVVHTRQAGQVTLAVDDLQLVDHIGGNVFRGHCGVVAEKLLAVDENLAHLLAVGGDFAVTAHLNARQTLEQVLDHGIGLCLIGVGIEFDGVLLDDDGALDAHDDCLLEHNGIGIHLDHTDIHVTTVLTDGDVLDNIVVAQIREAQQVLARLDALDVENAVHVGRGSLDQSAVFGCFEQPHGRFDKLGGVLRIHQHAVDDGSTHSEMRHAADDQQ